jgi:cytoskeletal protein CcmA (bactofilin family)
MFHRQFTQWQQKRQLRPSKHHNGSSNHNGSRSMAFIIPERRGGAQVPSIVSAEMTVRGDLTGSGDLQIEGKVYGRIKIGNLVVAEGGMVEGDIVAKAVSISGSVRGSIRAGTVTLSATAKVAGDILHDVLAIEAGAQIEGQCKRICGTKGESLADRLLSAPEEAIVVETDTTTPTAAAN